MVGCRNSLEKSNFGDMISQTASYHMLLWVLYIKEKQSKSSHSCLLLGGCCSSFGAGGLSNSIGLGGITCGRCLLVVWVSIFRIKLQ